MADQLDPQQLTLMNQTAASICNTVIQARGQKTDKQIEGDIRAQLGGLACKLLDVGASGKGAITQSEFGGLTQEATAEAFRGDRDCRDRIFNKLLDKYSPQTEQPMGAGSVGPQFAPQTEHVKGPFVRSDVKIGSIEGADVKAYVSAGSGWRIKRGSAHLVQLAAANASPVYGRVEETDDFSCQWFQARSINSSRFAMLAMYVEAVQWRPAP